MCPFHGPASSWEVPSARTLHFTGFRSHRLLKPL